MEKPNMDIFYTSSSKFIKNDIQNTEEFKNM